ncbi:MAG: leucine-rich repeat domain-containing protein, partial [Simkaniaceae bacterium]|nr:leucine-rich repeat domain-containing protein [Simkaniaceae bacterium]
IGQLTNLQELYLTQNQLTELPPAIGLLTNLQQLHLYRNQLTELPETLEYSRLQISLSQGGNCGNVVYNFVSAATAYRFFQLNAEQKNAVYGGIYHLAINAGENIESWDSQYGEYHVFDHEERLVAAMSEL